MDRRHKLLDVHAQLTAAIRTSEPWEKSYTDSPATFKRLVNEEAVLQSSANGYLVGLHDRIPTIVNWHEAGLQPILARAVPSESDDIWKAEKALLSAAVLDHLIELYVIGGNAGEFLYSRPIGITTLNGAIIYAARHHTATLVSQVTKTTRTRIQQSIKQSVLLGENIDDALARIRKLVANPVRAEMIAQTESVNAYQGGLDIFGDESGVKSWTWDALSGACQLCAPLDGVTKKVGQLFTLGNGTQVSRPAAHTRCRCGRIANYDK